ncbi:MAG: tetratricopeptide repeat protein [Candidatus Cloacimonetes bacterium]|nr:tetratricopeptide repeat protein [Candidatus Cloacimonadota bacterium]
MEREAYLEQISNSKGIDRIRALLSYSRYQRQHDPAASCELAKQALILAEELEDSKLTMSAISHIGYGYFYNSEFPEAIHWSNILLKSSVKNKDPKMIGASYNLKARISFRQTNLSLSLEYLLKALDYYLETNSRLDLMCCYNDMGMIHQYNSEMDEAYHYFNLALQIAEETDSPSRHSIRMNVGNTLFDQKKYEESLDLFLKSLDYFRKQGLRNNEASVLHNIGVSYSHLGDLDKSEEFYLRSYELHKEINEPNDICRVCYSLASLLLQKDNPEAALPYLEESLLLATTHNMKRNIEMIYDLFASYYEKVGDFKQAVQYLRNSMELSKEIYQERNNEKIAELEIKYKTQIYKLKNAELDEKTEVMSHQINELNNSLLKLQNTHQKLKIEFQNAVNKLNSQDDILSSQSRMSVVGEMVSSIAHQWKQPLNVINLLAQSITDAWDFNELDKELLEKQVELISGQIQYMNETINDFRNFFKPETIEEFNLEEAVTKALKLAEFTLENANVKVETEYDRDFRISGNPNEIVQVLLNIINNASEAMQGNSIPDPLIRITLQQTQSQIFFRIFNKGPQLSEEIKAKLFEPYFTTKGKYGTGIGLYISRMIIENKYQGKLEMVNPADGVEFLITLPVAG